MNNTTTKGQIIKGKPVADKISEGLIKEVNNLVTEGINPKLAIVRVGARADDLAYERGALKRCKTIGIETEVVELDENINQEEYIKVLHKLNEDKKINGILTFRPLPKHLNEDEIKYHIDPKKDVDCFNPINTAKIVENDESGYPPCTPTAVVEILKHYDIELSGANITVIGRSMVVGKPVSMLLLNENATVTICHSKSKNLTEISSKSDVVVAAVGKAKMINHDYIKDGAVVIDVGINVDDEGNLCGDVDTDDIMDKARMLTPVPGGVGSVTTSILASHVVKACKLQNNK
ncbi:MAG: bifunctional 5,10-methylenetetrahydrofolate dehydrogenase/5,10-methenyltetrahydrofolate cyclohydrolase [Paraclostridium sordellii]|uniref:bifunctional 5,10-methylenetetrahydrofolate dehydrogenase/5,10-methenyltetrahydrofolate cyclohydrolase n=1 Tax=Paraclostridium sordellii TaxID=1505 RepID=UPI0005DB6734|nr:MULTISPECIES: bifunctional 5,10-methylenetetrahydrofolate dehydrogenase/5,10-methenyltetrahydrofolate cyclohydrolase [Paeniclostridium]MBW4862653.1 bifunctional 5,10-methylenetetrahydrofolate dehydrogenase/5,10-methenyltetrahydrofolate cyclohydrolase [Paeniclostridium sp.]MBW4874355.1 bifunctional 5,10-methylenetetrahydrofolate dehydrogenase/5,10-methenyltetrahydrofolate cyclohydrolase [Paeniclostridium sp.]CEP91591.1 bifunctional 5 [[Clostridium] sordellii] [Paeniclostridium sordellii]